MSSSRNTSFIRDLAIWPRTIVLWFSFAALITLVGIAGCETQTNGIADGVAYETIDRTDYFLFKNGNAIHGAIVPDTREYDLTGKTSESLGYPIYDCSDAKFICLRAWYSVFAVPRNQQLDEGMTYDAAGVRFRVLSCLQRSDHDCRAALIAGDCQRLVEPDTCAIDDSKPSTDGDRQITYFVYQGDVGVTAFGVAGMWPSSPQEVKDIGYSVASYNVLQGLQGLLKATVETAKKP